MKKQDFTWQRFWKLLVLWFYERKWKNYYWKCKCDCWNEITTKPKGKISCWCVRWEKSITKHGLWRSRFYKIRYWIRDRCLNKESKYYKRRWLRWINIEWNDFQEFRDDMYESYLQHVKEYWEKNTTIDREDNNWNYSKENCRRATNKEQLNNTNSNRYLENNWQRLNITQRSKKTWIAITTIYSRIKSGWNTNDILTKPVLNHKK